MGRRGERAPGDEGGVLLSVPVFTPGMDANAALTPNPIPSGRYIDVINLDCQEGNR